MQAYHYPKKPFYLLGINDHIFDSFPIVGIGYMYQSILALNDGGGRIAVPRPYWVRFPNVIKGSHFFTNLMKWPGLGCFLPLGSSPSLVL